MLPLLRALPAAVFEHMCVTCGVAICDAFTAVDVYIYIQIHTNLPHLFLSTRTLYFSIANTLNRTERTPNRTKSEPKQHFLILTFYFQPFFLID